VTPARFAAAGAAGAAVLVTLPGGGRWFAAAVLLWGGVVLLELAVAGHRPLVPAAAVGGLGPPVGVLTMGQMTWDGVPMVMAAMLLAAFVLALVSARRRTITLTLGATVLPALVVGLGTAGVLVLRSATAGFRWTLGMVAVAAFPVVLGALAGRSAAAGTEPAVRVVSGGAVCGALLFGLSPPFGAVTAVVLAGVGLAAGWAATVLAAVIAGQDADVVPPGGRAAVLTALAAPLLAAPVAAFLAFATQS
jgi:hypothetical protein